MTAPIAPIANVDPVRMSQKGTVRTAWETARGVAAKDAELSAGGAVSPNASGATPKSSGEERVTQMPTGRSTTRINVPSNSSPWRQPRLRARKFTSMGATTPPRPRPK